jgi:hypothetical protein
MLSLFYYNRAKLCYFLKLVERKKNPIRHQQKTGTKTGGKGLYIGIAAANNVTLVEYGL